VVCVKEKEKEGKGEPVTRRAGFKHSSSMGQAGLSVWGVNKSSEAGEYGYVKVHPPQEAW